MNFEIKDDYSSRIDSLSNTSNKNMDHFICLTKDGAFSSNLLNIYFSIDYIPNKKWLINVRPHISMKAM